VFSVLRSRRPDLLNGASVPDLFAWKDRVRSFESFGALYNTAVDFGAEENGMPAERVQGEIATPCLLQALGAQPMLGRLFTEAEGVVDRPPPAIVSHSFVVFISRPFPLILSHLTIPASARSHIRLVFS
jgi:hypothetical protein